MDQSIDAIIQVLREGHYLAAHDMVCYAYQHTNEKFGLRRLMAQHFLCDLIDPVRLQTFEQKMLGKDLLTTAYDLPDLNNDVLELMIGQGKTAFNWIKGVLEDEKLCRYHHHWIIFWRVDMSLPSTEALGRCFEGFKITGRTTWRY